jgi:hypothetical protein
MPSALDNPFRAPSAPRDPEAEHASVREILGEEAAAAYKRLQQTGETPLPSATLTEEEKKAAASFEVKQTPEQIRAAWQEFFTEYGIEDCAITLNADGSVDVEGSMNLNALIEPSIFPTPVRNLSGHLSLESLTSAEGLALPQTVGSFLDLQSLTSAKGLTLPQFVGGTLYLVNLTSAEGLTFPSSIGGDLDLRSLTSAVGLSLPQAIGGNLIFRNCTPAARASLRTSRPDLAGKIFPNP